MSNDLTIIYRDLSELIPYDRNPRNNEAAVGPVAESIRQFGFKCPIIIDGNDVIVAGHTRLLAAKKLGLDKVPCVVADDLTEEQIKAFRLADNKVSELAEWNADLLGEELKEITDIDMSEFGFELSEFDVDTTDIQEDEVPDVPAESVCKLGDLWQLGDHRLICGDSTDVNVIDRLMDGVKAQLLLTDPPYGINADKGVGGFGSSPKTANKYDDEWDSFSPSKDTFDMILEKADNSIIFGGNYFTDKLPLGKCWIVWDKVGDIQFQNPYSDCELAWTNIDRNSVKKYTKIQQGFVADEKEKRVHPTQKPVGMLADILKDFSEKNDSILDCFGGSGSTLIACEQLNRTCYMVELAPHYCDVIIQRWENFTGKKARLLNQNETMDL